MAEPGWKLIDKSPLSKRRIVKKTYSNYPLNEAVQAGLVLGFATMMLGVGSLMHLHGDQSFTLLLLGGVTSALVVRFSEGPGCTVEEYEPEEAESPR